jgi:cysteine desulfurase/selenocysteine lyase
MTISNLSGFNDANQTTQTVDQNVALPDVTQLEKLANQFFSALPCDGSGAGLGIASAALSNVYNEQLSSIDKAFIPGTSPQHFGLPGEAELQKLFAPRSASVGSYPDSKLATSHPDKALGELSTPQQSSETSLFNGINTHGFDLPGEAELKKLLAQHNTLDAPKVPEAAPSSPFYFLTDSTSFNRGEKVVAPNMGFANPAFDVSAVRRDFPILKEQVNGHQLVWFDNAATTQKPKVVIDRVSYFYEHENSNIHRAAHELAARSTDAYEKSRDTVAKFLNASSSDDIVFVRGTTEAINLVAQSWGRQNIQKDDEIVITWLEHHANIVPWQMLCSETGAVLRVAPVDEDGQVILQEYQKLLNAKTKLVSFTQVSNALGTVTPAKQMIEMAHRVGAKVLLDGAQSVSHLRADVQVLDCDWFVFSGHKIFAPTGIGALYGKPDVLESMQPWQGGGNMIEDVTFEKTIYQPAPARFEAGTGNIADAVGLGAALEYVSRLGIENIARYEHELLVYAMDKLNSIQGLRLIGTAPDKTSVLSFVLAGHSNQDIGVALNKVGIAVRTGHHCAQPILRRFGLESTVRPSLALYNTHEEVDHLVDSVRKIKAGGVYSF